VALGSFILFLLSMILFITAEVVAVIKIKRKPCSAVSAFLWFEVLGFLSVKKDRYVLYDKGSDRLKDCEKQWWNRISQYAKEGVLSPQGAWKAITDGRSESAVYRYIALSKIEMYARVLGIVFYTLSLIGIIIMSGTTAWVWGSLLIPLWNVYKLYYVYGLFRPIVLKKAHKG